MKEGDIVRVRLLDSQDEWAIAQVVLVSENSKSVLLYTQGMVRAGGGFVLGALPLSIDYDKGTVTSLLGDEYEIEVDAALQSTENPSAQPETGNQGQA